MSCEIHTIAGRTVFVERRHLRDYIEGADGTANPLQWWVWAWMDEEDDSRDWIGGPFTFKRDALACLEKLGR